MSVLLRISTLVISLVALTSSTFGQVPTNLLLLAQGPDGHPRTTHEYVAGQQILAKLLRGVPELKITIVNADGDWPAGPELLGKADHCVLFVSEGAKWVNASPARREAFQKLAKRKGGLSVLHWGMGTKDAENIDPFVQIFGACHGGPDRKHKVVEATCTPASAHPATTGVKEFKIKEEFYYALKQDPNNKSLTSLLTAKIDDRDEMVAWAWERPDGGRSFGFSGLHYHANWRDVNYQRLVSQSVLWTMKVKPLQDFPAKLDKADFELPEPTAPQPAAK
jgi:type 1 glutamine amidotransferase